MKRNLLEILRKYNNYIKIAVEADQETAINNNMPTVCEIQLYL